MRSLFNKGGVTRPKYRPMLDEFAARIFDPLAVHIKAKNFLEFEKAYFDGVELTNKMHVATKHGEIIWKLPATRPPHLDLGSQE